VERRKINLLLVEDIAPDARRVQVLLSRYGAAKFIIRKAQTLQEAMRAASEEPLDVILLDLGLPDSEGLRTFTRLHDSAGNLPIVVLTSLDDESTALRAVLEGAQDHLLKSELHTEVLAKSLLYAIGRQQLITELKEKAECLEASESNFRNVLMKNVDGILVVDMNGIVRFANTAAEDLLGKSRFDLLGQNLGIPLVRDETTELRIVRTEGETAYVESRIVRSQWEGDTAYIVTLRDITARKKLESELEEARRREQQEKDIRFDIIVRSMNEGVLVVKDGLVHFANDALVKLLGVELDDLLGRPVGEEVRDEVWRDFFRRFAEGPGTLLDEIELNTGSGVRYFNARAEAIALPGARDAGCVCVFTDITEYRRMDRLKNELIGFASHELRGPLAVIKGYISTILLHGFEKMKEQASEFLVTASDEINRLVRLADTYLDISRIEQGKSLELITEEIDVRCLVEHAVAIVKSSPLKCAFETHISDEVSSLRGDRDKLLQVLYNLLSNAGKNSPPGEKVSIAVERGDGSIHFEIADLGMGIAREDLDNLFTPFYQANGKGSKKMRGTGLGLYLSKCLVESHGGCIGIDTELGRGTRAWFTIPAR
jgi:signal transduction histidine kinase